MHSTRTLWTGCGHAQRLRDREQVRGRDRGDHAGRAAVRQREPSAAVLPLDGEPLELAIGNVENHARPTGDKQAPVAGGDRAERVAARHVAGEPDAVAEDPLARRERRLQRPQRLGRAAASAPRDHGRRDRGHHDRDHDRLPHEHHRDQRERLRDEDDPRRLVAAFGGDLHDEHGRTPDHAQHGDEHDRRPRERDQQRAGSGPSDGDAGEHGIGDGRCDGRHREPAEQRGEAARLVRDADVAQPEIDDAVEGRLAHGTDWIGSAAAFLKREARW
jgi:hypothetical protein